MKITKYGHSCLLVEENFVKIVTDPGKWNRTPDATNVNAILITHEHQDHFELSQVKEILEKSPEALVITHEAVAVKLAEAGIPHVTIEPGGTIDVNGVSVESFGTEHAIIYGSVSPCRNTGYLIAGKLFAPGDALHDIPSKPVEILALPCGGPWMRLSEAIDYAKKVKPKAVFPIHDAIYTEEYRSDLIPRIVGGNLENAGITFADLAPGASAEF